MVKLSRAAQALADAGLLNPRLAALAAQMEKFKQRNVPMGKPLAADDLEALTRITPAVVARARADWKIALPGRQELPSAKR